MTKSERNTFIGINSIVAISGVVYFIFKYFFEQTTDFGLRPHPYTSTFLHIHILLVPFMLVVFGYLLKSHIVRKLKSNLSKRKKSGISILVFFIVMSFSGHLLQIGLDPSINIWIGYLHVALAFLWVFFSFLHLKSSTYNK